MAQSTARGAEFGGDCVQDCLLRHRLKAMTGVMTMFQANMAGYAEIIVLTNGAGDKVCLIKGFDKSVPLINK